MNQLLFSIILLQTDQADKPFLLASEKIYSVLTVLLLVFGAMIFYLILTNRKVKELEKKIEE